MIPATQSLRWKLQLWYGFILSLVVFTLLATHYSTQREQLLEQFDTNLRTWATRVAETRRVGGPQYPGRRPRPRSDTWLQELELPEDLNAIFSPSSPDQAYYALWTPRGLIQTFSNTAPSPLPYPDDLSRLKRFRTRGPFREYGHFLPEGTVIMAGAPMAPVLKKITHLRYQLVAVGSLVLCIGFLGGWLVISYALRPIQAISHTADQIAAGQLQSRIPNQDPHSELGVLAGTLNDTFERLERLFAQQVRFTADASHELRTPIAVVRSKAQLALNRSRSEEEYRDALQVCHQAAIRMGDLVESLLTLARIDSQEEALELETFDVSEMINESIGLVSAMAQERGIRILTPDEPLSAYGVPLWTQQVITNILVNAIRYSPDTEKIQITSRNTEDFIKISITDHGPGIPSHELEHLFDRFYRVDKARSRQEGGSGLGLAICKAFMEAQQGQITVASTVGHGTAFTIALRRTAST